MLNKSEKHFAFLFSILLFVELIAGSFEELSQWRIITKPSIILSLLLFFWFKSRKLNRFIRVLTGLALLLSLIGDVLLLFVELSAHFFLLGLLFFFLAHTMYITVFLRNYNRNTKAFTVFIGLLIYALWLLYMIQDRLGDLLFPVLLYVAVILTMAITAYMRKGATSKISYKLVMIGAFLFLISDSILALNKFYMEMAYPDISIMLTYGFSQFFIVLGVLKAS